MPSKPRTLAGILRLRLRRHADRAYNLVQRDPAIARIHGSARWQAVRAQVLRDEPDRRACAPLGLTEPRQPPRSRSPSGVSGRRLRATLRSVFHAVEEGR